MANAKKSTPTIQKIDTLISEVNEAWWAYKHARLDYIRVNRHLYKTQVEVMVCVDGVDQARLNLKKAVSALRHGLSQAMSRRQI